MNGVLRRLSEFVAEIGLNQKISPRIDLFFVGAPRSGTTMLGQILNLHPNILLANEHRVLDKVFCEKADYRETLGDATRSALDLFKVGLEGDKHFSATLSRYQRNWSKTAHLHDRKEFKKREILVAGDKKAGGTAKLVEDFGEEFFRFIEERDDLRFLQVVRHPLAAGYSLMRSHDYASIEEALAHIVRRQFFASEVRRRFPEKCHVLHYEDLVSSPEEQVRALLSWLDLEVSDTWLRDVALLVNDPTAYEFSSKDADKMRIEVMKHDNDEVFGRYESR